MEQLERIIAILTQRPELSLVGAFAILFVIWWAMGRALARTPQDAGQHPSQDQAQSPQVSSPGSVHGQWFDGLEKRLRDFGAGESPFADNFDTLREALQDGPVEKAIVALAASSTKSTGSGRELLAQSRQHLLGAAIARIAAGDLELALQNSQAAVEHFRLAMETVPAGCDELLAESLNKHGTAHYRMENHEKAIISFKRALKLMERVRGPNDPDVASVLNNLALLYCERGEDGTARPLYERALKIDEAASGSGSSAVAMDLNNLGLLLKKQGLLDEAEPLLRRALAIKEQALESGHPSLVTGLRNYATLLRALDRKEEAAALDIRLG